MLSWRRGDAFRLTETWQDVANGICELASKHEELEKFFKHYLPIGHFCFHGTSVIHFLHQEGVGSPLCLAKSMNKQHAGEEAALDFQVYKI